MRARAPILFVAVLAFVGVPRVGLASPILVTGFEVNDGTAAPNTKSVEFCITESTAHTITLVTQSTTGFVHNANNGGATTSHFATKVAVTGSGTAYYNLCSTEPNGSTLSGVCQNGDGVCGDKTGTCLGTQTQKSCGCADDCNLTQLAVAIPLHLNDGNPTTPRSVGAIISSKTNAETGKYGANWTIDGGGHLNLFLFHPGDNTDPLTTGNCDNGNGTCGSGTGTCHRGGATCGCTSDCGFNESVGQTGETVPKLSCTGTAAALSVGCAANADCATNACGSGGGSPGVCNTTTGAGCYWPVVEVTESLTAPYVTVALWVNGRRSLSKTSYDKGLDPLLGPITDVRLGVIPPATGTESASFTYYLDDVVLDDGTNQSGPLRAGRGFVETVTPLADLTEGWALTGCSGCSSVFACCVDDYAVSSFLYDGNTVQTGLASKTLAFCSTQPALSTWTADLTGNQITAVDAVAVGTTGTGAGTRDLLQGFGPCQACSLNKQSLGTCTGATGTTCGSGTGTCSLNSAVRCGCNADCVACAYTTGASFNLAASLGTTLFQRLLFVGLPQGGGSVPWTAATVGQLGWELLTKGDNGAISKLGAAALNIRVQTPDLPPAITLRDRNGALDPSGNPKVSVLFVGDSRTGATQATGCIGGSTPGAPCSQPSYASWDATSGDHPTGGCGSIFPATAAENASVQVCAGNTTYDRFNFPRRCGPNNGNTTCDVGCTNPVNGACGTDVCSGGSGTCGDGSGTCAGDGTVACGCAADCNFGKCDACARDDCSCGSNADCPGASGCSGGFCTTGLATCIASCPGNGVCPTSFSSYPSQILNTTGVDTLTLCSTGAQTSGGGVVDILGTGACPFSETSCGLKDGFLNPHCFLLRGTGACSCQTNGQCGSLGTCNLALGDGAHWGLCTAGAGASCTSGASGCTNCTANSDCPSGVCTANQCTYSATLSSTCVVPTPDYMFWLEGAANLITLGYSTNCTGPSSLATGGSGPCAPPSLQLCKRNSDCNNVWVAGGGNAVTDAECFGYLPSGLPTVDACAYPGSTLLAAGSIPCTERTLACNHANYTCTGGSGTCADGSGTCTTTGLSCGCNADCAGCPCPNGNCETCVSGTGVATALDDPTSPLAYGHCACTADNQCPTGFLCAGYTSSITECGNGTVTCTCHLQCTGTSDLVTCGNVTGACVTGIASGPVCQGACTYPSDARACTVGASNQCQYTGAIDAEGKTTTLTGTCLAGGKCSCTGINSCRPACQIDAKGVGHCAGTRTACTSDATCRAEACAPQYAQYHQAAAGTKLADIKTVMAALPRATDPLLIPITEPSPNLGECADPVLDDVASIITGNVALLRTWTHVADGEAAMAALPSTLSHVGIVHYSIPGGQALGGNGGGEGVGAYLNTLGTCAEGQCLPPGSRGHPGVPQPVNYGACTGGNGTCGSGTGTCALLGSLACGCNADCAGGTCGSTADCSGNQTCTFGAFARPEMYCKNGAGTFSSTSCNTDADCPSDHPQCVPRPCACACTDDYDCTNWYGSGNKCCSGTCFTTASCPGGTDTCVAAWGTGYACAGGICKHSGSDPCTSQVANNACNLPPSVN